MKGHSTRVHLVRLSQVQSALAFRYMDASPNRVGKKHFFRCGEFALPMRATLSVLVLAPIGERVSNGRSERGNQVSDHAATLVEILDEPMQATVVRLVPFLGNLCCNLPD